ncbi:MAG: hypothetical protein PVG87_19375 [Desulfobacteraceae bacterium]
MTEVIYTNKSKPNKLKDQIIANEYHCVEMKPTKALPIYQFKLHPHSNLNGAYVLIKDQSEILKHLKSGEKVNMLYHPKKADDPVEHFKTQILDITKKEQGPLKGHFKVALSIVE